ncbi:MAG: hypothetical protein AAB546_00205 [Patescibacteria group bacterium]
MNPENTNQPTTQPIVPEGVNQPVVPQDAVVQDISKLKGFIQKLKQRIKEKRQASESVPVVNKNKLLMISLAVFVVLCILLVAASMYKSLSNGKKVVSVPTPIPEVVINATPTSIVVPSRYATDSAVLELEKSINEVDGQLSGTQIKESQLTPPTFDFAITF